MRPLSPDSPVFTTGRKKGLPQQPRNGGGDSDCEGASCVTPTSVIVGSPLTRELSDLSGSYVHGSPLAQGARGGVPRNIFSGPSESPLTFRQPWRQAYTLSIAAKENAGPTMPVLSSVVPSSKEVIMVEKNGGVEVVPPKEVDLPARPKIRLLPTGVLDAGCHDRFPIVILLMHPASKSYELLQLWLGLSNDTVRDVLQTIRHHIPHTWNQDYDGLVQPRGGRLNQLINCLRIRQFAAVPYEIWIAKPWALSADHTTKHADSLLDHLKAIGVAAVNMTNSIKREGEAPHAAEGVLTLSKAARKRIYAPDGTLTHHHAMQYLSFSPPFEFQAPPASPVPVTLSPARMSETSDILSNSSDGDALSHASLDLECDDQEEPTNPKSPALTLTDSSTQASQVDWDDGIPGDWDDGTVKMTANLRDGNRRFSLPSITALGERSLTFRKSEQQGGKNSAFRGLKGLVCLVGMSCSRRKRDETVSSVSLPDMMTSEDFSLTFDDSSSWGRHGLLTLYETEDEDERSMADIPLLRGKSNYNKAYEYAA